jgi:hypothetical protein
MPTAWYHTIRLGIVAILVIDLALESVVRFNPNFKLW